MLCAYGEEEDSDRRKRLEKVLTKAVEFSGKAQTNHGGWGYVTAHEGQGFDEGSVTITQLQGLRAAKNAGIVVPKTVIDKSVDYLKKCTTERGGIIYSLSMGGMAAAGQERPALTAAGVACSFSAGQYDSELAKKWLLYCRTSIGTDGRRQGHEYLQYYFTGHGILGEDRGKVFPNERTPTTTTWSKYKRIFKHILARPWSQLTMERWSAAISPPTLRVAATGQRPAADLRGGQPLAAGPPAASG